MKYCDFKGKILILFVKAKKIQHHLALPEPNNALLSYPQIITRRLIDDLGLQVSFTF